MSVCRITLTLLAAMAFSLPPVAQITAEDPGKPVIICPIDGDVEDGLAAVVERVVEGSKDARAIVFVVDTFGGLVDSAIAITDIIGKAECETVAYVTGKGAISAGALISFSCDKIILSPATNIGAASPVYFTTEGPESAGEKEVSFLRAKMASLAEVNGHNPAIGKAMVDKDIILYAERTPEGKLRVWSGEPALMSTPAPASTTAVEGEKPVTAPVTSPDLDAIGATPTIICAPGKLLTLTAREAESYGLSAFTAGSLDEALDKLGYSGAPRNEIIMTWAERFFRWSVNPAISGLLLMVGIGGLYLEIKTPGFGLPGIVGIAAFTLFFAGRYALGLAGWLDILLVALGFALALVEIFVLPGFGLAGIASIFCITAGILLAFTRRDTELPEFAWDYARLQDAVIALVIAFTSLGVFIAATWRLLPRTPFFRQLVLASEQRIDAGFVVQTAAEETSALGRTGVALTVLRPAGKGRFGDETLPVVSLGDYIEPGVPIVITAVEGNRYVVEPGKVKS